MKVEDVYKKMDSSLDGFFFKRPYTVNNFNYLLQILAEQKNYQAAIDAVEKMKAMGLKPNAITFNHLVKVCAKTRRMAEAEKIFEEAKSLGFSNSRLYTSIMNLYARDGNTAQCESIFREMKELGFKIDVATYTTIINANFKGRNLNRCWSIYESMEMKADEHLISLMIEICGKTKDVEKALIMIKELETMGIKGIAPQYNAIISALGSRDDVIIH